MNDLLRYQRQSVASAYRKLADEATQAALAMSDPHGPPAHVVRATVMGRVESVQHAHHLLSATAVGDARVRDSRPGGHSRAR